MVDGMKTCQFSWHLPMGMSQATGINTRPLLLIKWEGYCLEIASHFAVQKKLA